MSAPSVRRALGLLAGYVVATAAAAAGLVLFGTVRAYIAQSGQPLAQAQTLARIVPEGGALVGLILAICLPTAWIPLAVGLEIWRRVIGRHRRLGCIVAGTFAGVVSLIWLGAVVGGISRAMIDDALHLLPYAVPMGAFGGLVFWSLCFRRGRG